MSETGTLNIGDSLQGAVALFRSNSQVQDCFEHQPDSASTRGLYRHCVIRLSFETASSDANRTDGLLERRLIIVGP
jgi:hypothetical protein